MDYSDKDVEEIRKKLIDIVSEAYHVPKSLLTWDNDKYDNYSDKKLLQKTDKRLQKLLRKINKEIEKGFKDMENKINKL